MEEAGPLLLGISAGILGFGLVSRLAERSPVTPPLFFLLLGCLFGPIGLGWFPHDGAESIHVLAEFALVLVLFTDASRIDLTCLRREGSLPTRLLGIAMPLCIGLGALLAQWIFPALTLVESLLIAAILAPTDAALGQAVVSSPLVPVRIRQSLNVESGLNDGIALPIVLVLASLAGAIEGTHDTGAWIRFAALQVTLGPLTGVAVGVLGGWLLDHAVNRGFVNEAFQHLATLGLAGLAFFGADAIGGNGFIAAFVSGLALGHTVKDRCERLHAFGEAEGQLLTLLVFVVFGATLLPEALPALDGRILLYAVASLTVVRMIPVALSLLGTGLRWPSQLFLGWFGPRGLASILFLLIIVENRALAAGPLLQTIMVATVCLSTLAHGASAYPLARAYGAFVDGLDQKDQPEHEPAMDLRVRVRHAS